MPVLTINPHERAIVAGEPDGDFLDWIRAELHCPQIESVMLGPGVCLFLDQQGVFKKDQAFWQFQGAAQRLAGIGILCGVTAEGLPSPLAPEITPDMMAEHILWLPDVSIVKIDVTLAPTPTEHGLWPRVVTLVTWSDEQVH